MFDQPALDKSPEISARAVKQSGFPVIYEKLNEQTRELNHCNEQLREIVNYVIGAHEPEPKNEDCDPREPSSILEIMQRQVDYNQRILNDFNNQLRRMREVIQ